MKICDLCGHENNDSSEVCEECGASVLDTNKAEITEAVETTGVTEITEDLEDAYVEDSEITEDLENGGIESTEVIENYETTEADTKLPHKPLSSKTKCGIATSVIVVAALILFYFFGSLSILSKLGIVNTGRYISVVKNTSISENDEAPSVKLGQAFYEFFTSDASDVNWSAQKTDNGVIVKAEMVCSFDGQENTVATYSAALNFNGTIESQSFSAGSKQLDDDETLSVLQKVARYSNPEKKDYTTKDISSSKYNNRTYYYPSGLTVDFIIQFRGTDLPSFLEEYGLPDDVEGTTDTNVLQKIMPVENYAAMYGFTLDEIKEQLNLDDSVTGTMTWGEVEDEIELGNYGLTEDTLSSFRENYNFGEDVTLETKYKDIKDKLIKFNYDQDEKEKEEANETAENETENTEYSDEDTDLNETTQAEE